MKTLYIQVQKRRIAQTSKKTFSKACSILLMWLLCCCSVVVEHPDPCKDVGDRLTGTPGKTGPGCLGYATKNPPAGFPNGFLSFEATTKKNTDGSCGLAGAFGKSFPASNTVTTNDQKQLIVTAVIDGKTVTVVYDCTP